MSDRVQEGVEHASSIQFSGTESVESSPLLDSRIRGRTFHKFVWIIFLTILFGAGTSIGLYLLLQEEPKWYTTTPLYFIPRESWGAVPALTTILQYEHPVTRVQITQTGTQACATAVECAVAVQDIQRDHMTRLNQSDIVYNFLVAGDGRTYEGRGWRSRPGFGEEQMLLIAFLGDFDRISPNELQFNQAKVLIQEAIDQKILDGCFAMSLIKKNPQDGAGQLMHVFNQLKAAIKQQRLILKCNSIR